MAKKVYQGLSIDGGGILGIGTAQALMKFEKDSGKSILEQFDFISGTSTGGIITVLLGLGYSAEEIYNLYDKRGEEIFYKPGFIWSMNPFNPQYSSKKLEKILDEYCGEKTMKDLKLPVYITTSNIVSSKTHVFSEKHDDLLKDVVLRTTAAPTYFPPQGEWVDGALWANNPSLVGTLGFKRTYGCKFNQLKILSIGTSGDYEGKPSFNLKWMSAIHWIKPIITFLTNGTEDATEFFMRQLDLHTYERIDPKTKKDWQIDDMTILGSYSDLWEKVYYNNRDRFKKFFR